MTEPRGLLFWHKILILLTISICLFTIGIAVVVWRLLDQSDKTIGKETSAILSEQTEAFIEKLVMQQSSTLDVQLMQAVSAAEYGAVFLSEHAAHHSLQDMLSVTFLSNLYGNVSHCVNVYFAFPGGDMTIYPPKDPELVLPAGYHISEESFFPKPSEFREKLFKAAWTEVHRHPLSVTYDPVADAIAPVWSDGIICGYVGVSISINRLIAQFNQHQSVRGSYSFLTDTQLRLIGAPPHARSELSSPSAYSARGIIDLSHTENSELDRYLRRMSLGESAIQKIAFKDDLKYMAYHPLKTINWSMGLVIPVKMATSASIRMVSVVREITVKTLNAMMYWALALLGLTLITGSILLRRMTAPIRELSEASKDIGEGNFFRRAAVSGSDEMTTLSLAFNAMTDKIHDMITNLNRINDELKEKNLALEDSEKRYRQLVETMNEGVAVLNEKTVVIYVNQKLCDMLGYTRYELVGKTIEDLLDNTHKQQFDSEFEKRKKGGAAAYKIEWIRKNGESLPTIVSPVPMFDECGKFKGSFGVVTDLRQIRQMEARLNHALKMEAIGALAGGIAHDFNNLLTGIMGNASMLLLDTPCDHHHYEKLTNIEKYVRSGANLTRQLLGFARGGKYEVKATNMNDLIKKNADMFGRTHKEIKVHFRFDTTLRAVEADRDQMDQVLLNLFVNAAHAMPEGGELFLETENTILDEEYVKPYNLPSGHYVRISVTDTGIGMDKATQQRVFEPFFTTKEMGRGTGLGLATAYGIVLNHGGIINIYSEPGKGTTFTIYLPVSDKEAVSEDRVSDEIVKGSGLLLLIDDEDMILDVGAQMLTELGYDVLTANSGEAAIKIYQEHIAKIALVVLDMIMPEMSGGAVFERLKQINPDVKILLASGYSINGQAAKILEQGCKGFIQKPFTLRYLSEKISEILKRDKPEKQSASSIGDPHKNSPKV